MLGNRHVVGECKLNPCISWVSHRGGRVKVSPRQRVNYPKKQTVQVLCTSKISSVRSCLQIKGTVFYMCGCARGGNLFYHRMNKGTWYQSTAAKRKFNFFFQVISFMSYFVWRLYSQYVLLSVISVSYTCVYIYLCIMSLLVLLSFKSAFKKDCIAFDVSVFLFLLLLSVFCLHLRTCELTQKLPVHSIPTKHFLTVPNSQSSIFL